MPQTPIHWGVIVVLEVHQDNATVCHALTSETSQICTYHVRWLADERLSWVPLTRKDVVFSEPFLEGYLFTSQF